MTTAQHPTGFGPIGRLRAAVGGGQHLQHIVLLSGALALAAADQTIVGAVAPGLKLHLAVGNTKIGLLITVASLMAAATTLPFGLLADRTHRVRLLAACALEWSVAITVAGFSDGYGLLLASQLALGAGVGAAGPIVASLVGDLFPAGMRGRALGFIVAGEFAGAASGLLIAGELAALWSWRGSFWVLAMFGPVLMIALVVLQGEPARGGQRAEREDAGTDGATANGPAGRTATRRTPAGRTATRRTPAGRTATRRTPAGDDATTRPRHGAADDTGHGHGPGHGQPDENDVIPSDSDTDRAPDASAQPSGHTGTGDLAAAIRAGHIEPRPRNILDRDPARRPMTWAVRHVLSIPTNVVIIVSSALAYFYVAGVQAFAIVYLRGKFDLSQEVATALLVVIGAGVIAGILATGHTSDKLISRGHGTARPLVGGVCFLAAVVVFVPGFSTGSLLLAMPLLFVGAAALGGVNPPLDAARLDIVQSRLWGRAESIRTFCQNLLKAGSPLLFGYLSAVLGTGNNGTTVAQGGGAVGLNNAFLLLLALFVVAGIVLLVFRRGYLRDAATAMESEERVAAAQGRPDV